MAIVSIKHRGDFKKTERFLKKNIDADYTDIFDKYGKIGIQALSDATPIDSGKTASSWYYKINRTEGKTTLTFNNSNINDGVPIAIILQYGHGTGTGGYVVGRDYINPALQPVLDNIANSIWEEVTNR